MRHAHHQLESLARHQGSSSNWWPRYSAWPRSDRSQSCLRICPSWYRTSRWVPTCHSELADSRSNSWPTTACGAGRTKGPAKSPFDLHDTLWSSGSSAWSWSAMASTSLTKCTNSQSWGCLAPLCVGVRLRTRSDPACRASYKVDHRRALQVCERWLS